MSRISVSDWVTLWSNGTAARSHHPHDGGAMYGGDVRPSLKEMPQPREGDHSLSLAEQLQEQPCLSGDSAVAGSG